MTHNPRIPDEGGDYSTDPTKRIERREGPPRYFLPVCVCTPLGFIGGPSGYQEVGEDEQERGPVLVDAAEAAEAAGGEK